MVKTPYVRTNGRRCRATHLRKVFPAAEMRLVSRPSSAHGSAALGTSSHRTLRRAEPRYMTPLNSANTICVRMSRGCDQRCDRVLCPVECYNWPQRLHCQGLYIPSFDEVQEISPSKISFTRGHVRSSASMRRRYRIRMRQNSSDCNPFACANRCWGASADRDAMPSREKNKHTKFPSHVDLCARLENWVNHKMDAPSAAIAKVFVVHVLQTCLCTLQASCTVRNSG